MTDKPNYLVMVSTQSIVVVHEGTEYNVREGQSNYAPLRRALEDREWDRALTFLTVESAQTKGIEDWCRDLFTVRNGKLFYGDRQLDDTFQKRVAEMVAAGQSPDPLFRFFERLDDNPSWRAIEHLFDFLRHGRLPITKGGMIVAYKGVKADFTDCRTGRVDNRVGSKPRMRRNHVSDDANVACHKGFHAGSEKFANTYGRVQIVVLIDPADVVCIPKDNSQQKVRVCGYEVIGVLGGELPCTILHVDGVIPRATTMTYTTGDSAKAVTLPLRPEPVVEGPEVVEEVVEPKVVKIPVVKESQTSNDPSSWGFGEKTTVELWEEPLSRLRKYASKVLHIIGASKIPGGKQALIDKITHTRECLQAAEATAAKRGAQPEADKDVKTLDVSKKDRDRKEVEPWVPLIQMSMKELESQPLGILRQYARHTLDIVGASKIKGGKKALLARIKVVRNPRLNSIR
jgi:hypothetical protein